MHSFMLYYLVKVHTPLLMVMIDISQYCQCDMCDNCVTNNVSSFVFEIISQKNWFSNSLILLKN